MFSYYFMVSPLPPPPCLFHFTCSEIYHGINGNVSLDRRGELLTSPPNRYDLTLGSDKSSSLSRSEAGVYDIGHAENSKKPKQHQDDTTNITNNNQIAAVVTNGNGTMDSMDSEAKKRVCFAI